MHRIVPTKKKGANRTLDRTTENRSLSQVANCLIVQISQLRSERDCDSLQVNHKDCESLRSGLFPLWLSTHNTGFPGGSGVKSPPAKAGDAGSIPGLGRSPGGGNGTPF